MTSAIGLITARGGSKGIPRKNVKLLAGKPLIAWTIEAALQSRALSRVIVSTEDEEIAAVSREWGAEVPFMRPAELAQDHSSHIAVVLHTLEWLSANQGQTPHYMVLLQPTTPLKTAEDIRGAIALANARNADSLVTVSEVKHHPYWTLALDDKNGVTGFNGVGLTETQQKYPRRQDLPCAYAENGAVYLAQPTILFERRAFYGDRLYAYVMPEERSLDIDTVWDLHLAQLILQEGTRHDSSY